MSIRSNLDDILRHLVTRPIEFYQVSNVMAELKIPLNDKTDVLNIVENLERHKHIEVRNERYDYPSIKITPEGIEFINRTSYEESADVGDIKISGFMSAHAGPKQKDILEKRPLELNVQALQMQVADYPKIRKEARIAIICAILSGGISAIALMIQLIG